MMKCRTPPFTSGKGESKRPLMVGLCIFLSVFLISASADASSIYRWVSGDGVVSYGETPPAGAKDVEQISGAPQNSVSTPESASSGSVVTPSPAPSAAPTSTRPAVNPALKRMQAELVVARLALLQATKNYEQGKAIRTGNERNYARYLDRVNGLKQAMDAAQLRVLLLQRQIQQVQNEGPAPTAPGRAAH
ncbi:DUF4124 domain-containing protein [Acidithiobacillus ferriphilus]|uniref:DUF4124 domain-containing protein n=1 Tax=Acidithiobacillus ferriphilus TaxID=1689834 RepID=UPI0023311A3B|nr:DUF4124 domain-containing protein [Acidithiobacillus ferriphilus]WCE94510.1 DUF4124 domain-containing protein [Acidithiobacillus ferriphilus]